MVLLNKETFNHQLFSSLRHLIEREEFGNISNVQSLIEQQGKFTVN